MKTTDQMNSEPQIETRTLRVNRKSLRLMKRQVAKANRPKLLRNETLHAAGKLTGLRTYTVQGETLCPAIEALIALAEIRDHDEQSK